MEKFRNYDVSFTGLSLGNHDYDFHLTQAFFDLFEFEQEFLNPDLSLQLNLDKKSNFLELKFTLKGNVELICDITNEPFSQKLKNQGNLLVKFGEQFDDSDDEILVLPHGEHAVNIAQFAYELTLLAIPQKRIHPNVAKGKSHSKMLEFLDKYSIHTQTNEEEIDPRWEKLNKLKNNN